MTDEYTEEQLQAFLKEMEDACKHVLDNPRPDDHEGAHRMVKVLAEGVTTLCSVLRKQHEFIKQMVIALRKSGIIGEHDVLLLIDDELTVETPPGAEAAPAPDPTPKPQRRANLFTGHCCTGCGVFIEEVVFIEDFKYNAPITRAACPKCGEPYLGSGIAGVVK